MIATMLRKIKQTVRSYNQVPATIEVVDTMAEIFVILEERIQALSIKAMNQSERINELENKSCCKEDNSGTDVSVPKVQPEVRDESGDETVSEPELPKSPAKTIQTKGTSPKSKKD